MAQPRILSRIAVACIALALAGCASMAPSYERPAAPVPAQWPTGAAYAQATDQGASAADLPWRQFILDTRLQQVVAQALDGSRDLRKAIASIESARAQYGQQRADLFPTVSAGLDASRSRTLNNGTAVTTQSVSATASVSAYELDLFGKTRSLTDAALQTYLASAEAARATRIALIAETANAWLALAADQDRLATARQTMQSAQRSMEITRKRQELGVASAVDTRSAETVYQQARADVAAYTASVAQDRNALELLAGGPVADALLPDALPQADGWLAEVPTGLSSEVLLRRPDVLQAEHQLQSANANIGAARAAFFPSVSLTASGGIASATLATLFSGGTGVWSFAPAISLPIFDGGARQASLDYYRAEQKVSLNNYESAIQTAFEEVANALATRGTIGEQLAAQRDLVSAAADSERLSTARYQRGVDTYLNALTAQRTLYSARLNLVTTRLGELQSRVTLYRVLGGGLAGEVPPAS
ncbi:MAG: efflux transporter outer membrane subunit [Pseudorhodoferax sp.]